KYGACNAGASTEMSQFLGGGGDSSTAA
ncbi:uncharacterized protein METZ01_LOCUS257587, partial [marine metagenome]